MNSKKQCERLNQHIADIKRLHNKLMALNLTLLPELIPKTAWGQNLRSKLSVTQWGFVRNHVYRHYDFTCQYCKQKTNLPHAHELWEWVTPNKVDYIHVLSNHIPHGEQKLIKVICVCEACHLAFHFGFANSQGLIEQSIHQMKQVNNIPLNHKGNLFAGEIYNDIQELWALRSNFEYNLNISPYKIWLLERNIF